MSSMSTLFAFIFCIIILSKGAVSIDYGAALTKSLLYYEAQRSGKLPSNQRVQWRGDSALNDGKDAQVDLVGGYFDAGDNVKFGHPMAFTVTMLAWSVVEYGEKLQSKNELTNALDAIKWGTDYFIKAHAQPNVLYGEVGEGVSDHQCWQRPEDMTTPRTSYKIDEQHPGSDLAGETAAALAAASIAFSSSNPSYSSQLITHAKQLFDFAVNHPGRYQDSIPVAGQFYSSSGFQPVVVGKSLPYANSGEYKASAEQFICNCIQQGSSNVQKTSGGLLWFQPWNNLQYTTSALFIVTTYADQLISTKNTLQCATGSVVPEDMIKFVQSQVDNILGSNSKNMSYMVGFGSNYPKKVHHRGASIISIKKDRTPVGCQEGFDKWFNKDEPNPNILEGAIVGGPDINDGYSDSRGNFQQAEPATANTAPLVGVLARLAA